MIKIRDESMRYATYQKALYEPFLHTCYQQKKIRKIKFSLQYRNLELWNFTHMQLTNTETPTGQRKC